MDTLENEQCFNSQKVTFLFRIILYPHSLWFLSFLLSCFILGFDIFCSEESFQLYMYLNRIRMIELSVRGEETHVPKGNAYSRDLAAMTAWSLVIFILVRSGSLS